MSKGVVDADFIVVRVLDTIACVRRIDSDESGIRAFPTSTVTTWLDQFPDTHTVLQSPIVTLPALDLPSHLVDTSDLFPVNALTSELLSDPAMGSYSYKEQLSTSAEDRSLLRKRFAGLAERGIGGSLRQSFSGKAVVAPTVIKSMGDRDLSK